jgi:hypothetical protein
VGAEICAGRNEENDGRKEDNDGRNEENGEGEGTEAVS